VVEWEAYLALPATRHDRGERSRRLQIRISPITSKASPNPITIRSTTDRIPNALAEAGGAGGVAGVAVTLAVLDGVRVEAGVEVAVSVFSLSVAVGWGVSSLATCGVSVGEGSAAGDDGAGAAGVSTGGGGSPGVAGGGVESAGVGVRVGMLWRWGFCAGVAHVVWTIEPRIITPLTRMAMTALPVLKDGILLILVSFLT